MNRQTRRTLIRFGVPAAAVAALAACQNPLNGPVQVNLTTAQQWAQTVTRAALGFAASAKTALGTRYASVAAIVDQAVATLDGVNATFQGLQSGATTGAGLAQQIIAAISALVGALSPLYPAIAAAAPEIAIALGVLGAFVTGLSTIVPPMPAGLVRAAAKYHG